MEGAASLDGLDAQLVFAAASTLEATLREPPQANAEAAEHSDEEPDQPLQFVWSEAKVDAPLRLRHILEHNPLQERFQRRKVTSKFPIISGVPPAPMFLPSAGRPHPLDGNLHS